MFGFFRKKYPKKKRNDEPARCVYAGPEYFRQKNQRVVIKNDTDETDPPEPPENQGPVDPPEPPAPPAPVYGGPEFSWEDESTEKEDDGGQK